MSSLPANNCGSSNNGNRDDEGDRNYDYHPHQHYLRHRCINIDPRNIARSFIDEDGGGGGGGVVVEVMVAVVRVRVEVMMRMMMTVLLYE